MNKKDIITKLKTDLTNAQYLVNKKLVSEDSRISLEAIIGYIETLLERIQQDGKV